MSRESPRALAARVLATVWQGARLDEALRQAVRLDYPARDAALVRELCYGTLRFEPRLEFWLTGLLKRPLEAREPELHALLLLGLYQLSEMRVPPHAAIAETVEACRHLFKPWAVQLANAVLRRFQREQAHLMTELPQHEAAYYAHPRWLLERIRQDWPDHWREILAAGNQRPPLTLRVNRLRRTRAALLVELAAAGIAAQACGFSAAGVTVLEPFDVRTQPGFAAGHFSVQDEAAQLAAELLEVHAGMRVLDACAAPGGKTCHLLECCPQAQLLALDNDAGRAQKIHQNLQRLGLAAEVKVADATQPDTWWDGRPFERILLDAPCSASGVIRRHPDIKVRRRPEEVSALVAMQAQMLAALWPLLASGGKLLYVTCSLLAEENAAQVDKFLAAHADARALPIAAHWGVASPPGRQILAGESRMDGFYYACLHKA
ncbi:MAG: 16S rRNA (cytosine(967)-C(5))-methyltransferase RsmB [Gammaproteobacteria bacterium]|nr:16S rRNA (cytosine(967)-C(5))-methyltransferase RsmB [Gammaproteobacteria bacterium]